MSEWQSILIFNYIIDNGYFNSIKYIKILIELIIIVKVLNFAQIRYILLLSSVKFQVYTF